jgi:hypothetical protein
MKFRTLDVAAPVTTARMNAATSTPQSMPSSILRNLKMQAATFREGKMSTSRVYIAKPAEGTAGEYSIDGYETSSVHCTGNPSPA